MFKKGEFKKGDLVVCVKPWPCWDPEKDPQKGQSFIVNAVSRRDDGDQALGFKDHWVHYFHEAFIKIEI